MSLIETTAQDLTQNLAWEVHCEVMAGKRQAAMGLYEMARALKRMRDERLFERLGYDDFPTYCGEAAKVNASQAYKYIKVYEELGATVLQSAGGMGIEKLFLVSQLPFDDKNEALADPEKIEGMSVSELKAFIAEARGHVEQISFLEAQLDEAKETISEMEQDASETKDAAAAADRIREEYEQRLEQAKIEADVQSAKEIAAIREKAADERVAAVDSARKQAAGEYNDKIAKLKADHAEEMKRVQADIDETEREKIAAEAKEAAEAEMKAELDKLRNTVEGANREKLALEKQLSLSDNASVTVKLYLAAIQDNYNKLVAYIGTLDGEQLVRCKSAVRKMVAALNDTTEKLMGE